MNLKINTKQDIVGYDTFSKKNRGVSRRKSLFLKFFKENRGDSRRKIKNEEIQGVSRSCGNPVYFNPLATSIVIQNNV